MAHYTDWLPVGRDGQLVMAKNRVTILPGKAAAWNIPVTEITELTALTDAAKNEATRTPVATAQGKTDFEVLTAKMRDIKKRYFYVPPLTDADLISLGPKVPDTTYTPSGQPTAQVTVETYLVGRHELGVKIIYVTGNPADPVNKGFRIWYSVGAPPGMAATVNPVEFSRSGNSRAENLPRTADFQQPPANPDDLRKSFFTKRKKDLIELDFGDSGKRVYFAVQ